MGNAESGEGDVGDDEETSFNPFLSNFSRGTWVHSPNPPVEEEHVGGGGDDEMSFVVVPQISSLKASLGSSGEELKLVSAEKDDDDDATVVGDGAKDHEMENNEDLTNSQNVNESQPRLLSRNFPTREIPLEGWLEKQPTYAPGTSHRRFSAWTWKLRYFTCVRGGLYYHSIEREESFAFADVVDAAVLDALVPTLLGRNQLNGYRFQVRLADNSVKVFACPSKQEQRQWVSHLARFSSNSNVRSGGGGENNVVVREWPTIAADPGGQDIDPRFFLFVQRSGTVYYLSGAEHWSTRELVVANGRCFVQKRQELGFFSLCGATCQVNQYSLNSLIVSNARRCINLHLGSSANLTHWEAGINAYILKQGELLKDGLLRQDSTPVEVRYFNSLTDMLEREERLFGLWKPNPAKKDAEKFFVLSFDGGGMRGMISVCILERLCELFPDFLAKVSCVFGTSNGAMTAMGLAFGHRPLMIREAMELTCQSLFSDVKSTYSVRESKYSNECLKMYCQRVWSGKKLRDAQLRVLVPALQLDDRNEDEAKRRVRVSVFHNFTDEAGQEAAADVVLRTTAAPTYFPSYQGYVDGGLMAHDPCGTGLAAVLGTLRVPLDQVYVLSISTGHVSNYYAGEKHDWGVYQWLPKLSSVIWESMIDQSQENARALLGDRLMRVDPVLDSEVPLDDPKQLSKLTEIGMSVDLFDAICWIKKHFYPD